MGHFTRNSALAAAVATAATFAIAPGAQATPDPPGEPGDSGTLASIGRIAGIDRIQTAVEASKAMVRQAKHGTVIIAGALQFPDALAAAPMADVLNAPILLTYQGSLDPRVRAEILRRLAAHVIIVGGEGTVGRPVADALGKLVGADNVDRIGGHDRYETAYDIAAETAAAYTRAGALPPGSADSVPAAAQLAQFNQALKDLIQAQEELAAAQANYSTVSSTFRSSDCASSTITYASCSDRPRMWVRGSTSSRSRAITSATTSGLTSAPRVSKTACAHGPIFSASVPGR